MNVEDKLAARESAVRQREEAAGQREQMQRILAQAQDAIGARSDELLLTNERLVIATLAAKELSEEAEAARGRQNEFLAMLAHELRNPLSAIVTGADMLARLDGFEARPALALVRDAIGRQARHMVRLLDDLLDVSRVTGGKVNLQRRPTAVADFIGQAVDTCRPLLDAQHQRLTLDIPVPAEQIDGDPVRLAQVVSNLLHNAAKYTPEGGVIALRVRAPGDTVEIEVEDNGIGISAEALPHIFDLFMQDERSLGRSQGGLGIGLTVVRSMVELHGGTVEARSGGPGTGCTFTVVLPRLAAGQALAASTPSLPAFVSTPARILLVDDNEDAGRMLAMLLSLAGHEVTVVLDGPSALASLEQVQPEVVLCDIGLPGMDGYQVAMLMRARGLAPMPLMIAVTGYSEPRDRARALAAGFDHHLIKPADPEVLLRLIETAASG